MIAAPAGVVGIDRSEGAASGAVARVPPAVGHDPVGIAARSSAGTVEHDLRAGASGDLQDLIRPPPKAVVDHGIGPGVLYCRELGLTPADTHHPGSHSSSQLNEENAHSSRGTEYHHPRAGWDAYQLGDLQRRRAVVEDGGGLSELHFVGHRGHAGLGDDRSLRIAARPTSVGDHPPSRPGPIYAGANGHHLPGHAAARHVWRAEGEVVDTTPGADQRIHEHHVAELSGDDHLAVARARLRGIGGDQYLRSAKAGHFDDVHRSGHART